MRRQRGDRGASAVEFALVVPVLIILVLGIIDFGLFFSDSLSLRYGTREGARRAVVKDFTGCTGGTNVARAASCTSNAITAVSGDVYVRVRAPAQWQEGADLTVCTAVRERAITGFTPLPGDGLITNELLMRIEQGPTAEASGGTSTIGGTPPGGWGWC